MFVFAAKVSAAFPESWNQWTKEESLLFSSRINDPEWNVTWNLQFYKGKGYTFYRESFWGDLFSMPLMFFLPEASYTTSKPGIEVSMGDSPCQIGSDSPHPSSQSSPVLHSPWRCFKTFGHPGFSCPTAQLYHCSKCDDPYYSVLCLFEYGILYINVCRVNPNKKNKISPAN